MASRTIVFPRPPITAPRFRVRHDKVRGCLPCPDNTEQRQFCHTTRLRCFRPFAPTVSTPAIPPLSGIPPRPPVLSPHHHPVTSAHAQDPHLIPPSLWPHLVGCSGCGAMVGGCHTSHTLYQVAHSGMCTSHSSNGRSLFINVY
jgi:hypothetical protein